MERCSIGWRVAPLLLRAVRGTKALLWFLMVRPKVALSLPEEFPYRERS